MADHPALTLLIERKMGASPRLDRAVAKRLFDELEPLFRQQWEDELRERLLSKEAMTILWGGEYEAADALAVEEALAATQKGGE
jgi:acyl transferase domain-containing protein